MGEQSERATSQSPSSEFGHVKTGYAVVFNLAGFACRSLTVESESEANVIKNCIEKTPGTSGVKVVYDA